MIIIVILHFFSLIVNTFSSYIFQHRLILKIYNEYIGFDGIAAMKPLSIFYYNGHNVLYIFLDYYEEVDIFRSNHYENNKRKS